MNVHAKMAFESALRRLEVASLNLETALVDEMPAMAGYAHADILLARGELAAALQLLALEDLVDEAKERTKLRLVR
jgi:hypothetical protein